jgi:cytochrome c oxidase cbb3-type subunit 3
MQNKKILIPGLLTVLLLLFVQPLFAAGPPAPSIFNNPLAIILIIFMLLLLIVIGILANIIVGAAEVKLKKRKSEMGGNTAAMFIIMLFLPGLLQAQDANSTVTVAKTIGGMESSTFYFMVAVLFIELLTIIGMLINIRFLLRLEKERTVTEEEKQELITKKAHKLSWWDRFNKLKPVSEEAALDLGHEYDGIRELNNRLPPWWLYGFYITIVFAAIYLWRFHVSHTGPSSKEEYERAVASAQAKVDAYLKKKGDAVDENTIKLLTSPEDLAAGKAIFVDPSKCPACHNPDGGGNAVGPNLTDDYWLYGGSIKDIFKTIKYGTSKGMRSWKDDLSAKQMAQLASYVKSLKGTKPANPKGPQGELYKEEQAAPSSPTDSASGKNPG